MSIRSLIVVSVLLVSFGCGRQPATETATAPAGAEASRDRTRIIDSTEYDRQGSPSRLTDTELTPDSPPEQVCRLFLEHLRKGDRSSAEHLMTRQALFETRRAELELEAPGSENAVYRVGTVRYATTKQEVAQVDCLVIDTVDGEQVEFPLTWIMRKQQSGWKVAGLVLGGDETSPGELLSFENADDVFRIKVALTSSDPEDVRHANLPDTSSNLK